MLTDATADLAIALRAGRDPADERDRGGLRAGGWDGFRATRWLGMGLQGSASASSAWAGSARPRRGGRRWASACGWSTSTARRSPGSTSPPSRATAIEAVLAEADVVSLHIPGGGGNRGIISAERLAAMKPTAYLVNTARGDIVDEAR